MTWIEGIIGIALNAVGACYGFARGIWLWPVNLAMVLVLLWIYYVKEVKGNEKDERP